MEHGSAPIGQVFNFGMLHLEWPTALFIFVVFVLTAIVLNALLFKPILRTLEARFAEIGKNEEETKNLSHSVEESEQEYQRKLADVRDKIQQARQQSIDEATTTSNQLLSKTSETIAAKLKDAEKEISEQRDLALKEAASLVEDTARLIMTKVLA